jgi:hypothetical protein
VARDFEVVGAECLLRASRAMKWAGDGGKGARSEMLRTIRLETKPLRQGLKGSALSTLPKRGGLNKLVAASSITTRIRTGARTAGVVIYAKGRNLRDVATTDEGTVRHPVFGNKKAWVSQPVDAGWWTKPLEAFGPTAQKALAKAMERIANDIVRRTKR